MNTQKIQKCGCEEDDCVEILELEIPIYACFTCGYAGITPSGAANYDDEVHIGDLDEEVKRLQKVINKAMQQHTVLKMREQLFESCCIDAEGQYESGHWEREEK
ncbi:MAG: hypothetical protein ACTSVR_06805 [Candidatus Thorarchaeota archaeon]